MNMLFHYCRNHRPTFNRLVSLNPDGHHERPDNPQRAASILVLGEPGAGKTTVIRDISRKVSATQVIMDDVG